MAGDEGRGSKSSTVAVEAITKMLAAMMSSTLGLDLFHLSWTKRNEEAEFELRKGQVELLQDLSQAGIDARLFDLMLSNELDRRLKKQFGIAFLASTIFFTLLSYGVIVFNSIQKWGISDTAITALIVETPIQFIGLLYIIARNLFPQSSGGHQYSGASVEVPSNTTKRRIRQATNRT